MEFINKLTQIRGTPPRVFDDVDRLLREHNLDPEPVYELRKIARYLDAYEIDWNKVRIDFGFGRGLQYYTGMIFEIYVHTERLGDSQKQVCGGGRYDELIRDLGGTNRIPALGFSFGFERLLLSLPEDNAVSKDLDAFVAPIGDESEFEYSLLLVTQLRKAGLRADVGSRGLRKLKEQLGAANRVGAKFTLIIGSDELSGKFISLKDMQTGTQVKCSIEEAIKHITNGVLAR